MVCLSIFVVLLDTFIKFPHRLRQISYLTSSHNYSNMKSQPGSQCTGPSRRFRSQAADRLPGLPAERPSSCHSGITLLSYLSTTLSRQCSSTQITSTRPSKEKTTEPRRTTRFHPKMPVSFLTFPACLPLNAFESILF